MQKQTPAADKLTYERPALTKHGKLDELTHGSGSTKVDGQSMTVQNN